MKKGLRLAEYSRRITILNAIFNASKRLSISGFCSVLVLTGCAHSPQSETLRWTSPRAVPVGAIGFQSLPLVRTADGNVFFAWAGDGKVDVYAQWMFRDGREWPILSLAPDGSAPVKNLRVSANTSGDSAVAWVRETNGEDKVMGVRLHHLLGMAPFSTPFVKENIEHISTATDRYGNTLVTWSGNSGKIRSLYCPAESDCVVSNGFANNEKVSIEGLYTTDLDTGFLLVWNEKGEYGSNLYARIFRDNRFEPIERLSDDSTLLQEWIGDVVPVIPGGVATAWLGKEHKIYVRRYSARKGWLPVERVTQTEKLANDLQLQSDNNGILHLLWLEDYSNYPSVWSCRGNSDSSWSPPVGLDQTSLPHDVYSPKLLVHDDGRVASVWIQTDFNEDINEVWGNGTLPSGNWGTSQKLPIPEAQDAAFEYGAMLKNAEGNTIWVDFEEDSWVYWLE